jgi:acetylornithine/N-succinyldiaminopimelate aminotransferase
VAKDCYSVVAVCLNGELVEALRAENLLAAAAGDNVVRVIPPLIVTEPEILDAVGRIDRAVERIEQAQGGRAATAS